MELIWGLDDICKFMLGELMCYCYNESVLVCDQVVVEEIRILLGGVVFGFGVIILLFVDIVKL